MATSCSSTCGGVKKAVAQVRESIRFCRASERGMASGSCDPAHAPSTVAKQRGVPCVSWYASRWAGKDVMSLHSSGAGPHTLT